MILSIAMLVPAIADLAYSHDDWKVFLMSSFLTAFFGGGLYFSNLGHTGQLNLRQTFLFTTSSWFILSFFACLPLLFSELQISFTDAYFEAVSGLTTTGSTVLSDLDYAPPGILLWRAILQGLGGVGVIVLAMAILPMLRVGGMQLFRSESSDTMDKMLPRARQIAKVIGFTYLLLTFLCFLAYWMAGMHGFDAICHAITTVATGGFSTHDASIGYFDSVTIELICMAGMLSGAIPMILYYQAMKSSPLSIWRDPQVRWFFSIIIISILLVTNWQIYVQEAPGLEALRTSAFNVISIITTSGFASADYNLWGTGAVSIFFILIVVGGCTGSTTGGIKVFRFQVLYETVKAQLHRLLQPNGVFLPRYDHKPISDSISGSVLSFFALFSFCFMVLAVSLSFFGLDFLTSMSAAAQTLANVGPGLGHIIGPAGNYATIPDGAKWLIAFGMIMGRLELFTVIVILTPYFWRD